MHHVISTPASLTFPAFPFFAKQPRLHPLRTGKPNHRRRITISSFQKLYNFIRTPPNVTPSPFLLPKTDKNPLAFIQKTLTAAVFCVTIGFFPTLLIPMPAIAAPAVASTLPADETARRGKSTNSTDHEYSEHTRRLLAAVAVLLQRIENVKSGCEEMAQVKKALKEVVLKREELQGEILAALNVELEELWSKQQELVERESEVFRSFEAAETEKDVLERRGDQREEAKEKISELEKKMDVAEREYNEICDKVGDIEDVILRKETMAYSIGIRELSFIQRECEALVEVFERRWKKVKPERYTVL